MMVSLLYALQLCINACMVSAVYALLAVAYVLMHGITGRVNFAFGAFAIWAGVVTNGLALAVMLRMPWAWLVPVLAGAAAALVTTTALGFATARLVIAPLVKAGTLAMMVATLGLAIALEEAMRLMTRSQEVWLPPAYNEPVAVAEASGFVVHATALHLTMTATAVGFAALFVIGIRVGSFGRIWRAVAQDAGMAELSGIDTGRVLLATLTLATFLSAAGGVMLAVSYGAVSYYSGLTIGLKTLLVAVVGGLNSLPGAFVGAVLIGVFETLWSGYVGGEYRDAASFALLTGLLILYPRGLLAGAERVDHRTPL